VQTLDCVQVLLVEDSDSDAELIRWALIGSSLAGGWVRARDGEEAMALLTGARVRLPDGKTSLRLVLLDLRLPRIDGTEVLRKIRRDVLIRHTPVVVLSSSDREQDIRTAYALGANSFVTKPVEYERFVATLNQVGTYWLSVNRGPDAESF
jgi:two-component system, response regulator